MKRGREGRKVEREKKVEREIQGVDAGASGLKGGKRVETEIQWREKTTKEISEEYI